MPHRFKGLLVRKPSLKWERQIQIKASDLLCVPFPHNRIYFRDFHQTAHTNLFYSQALLARTGNLTIKNFKVKGVNKYGWRG